MPGTHGFRSGIRASVDATYFAGGCTTASGVLNEDLQQIRRPGGRLAFPVHVHHSVKPYASHGAWARAGND